MSTEQSWELRHSDIHQQGMFATRDIAKGEKIIEYIGERIDKEESERRCTEQQEHGKKTGGAMVYVFTLNDEFDLDGNVPDNPAKFINHSCSENCEAINEDDRIFIYSKKRIRKDEEIVFDYGYDIEHFREHPCRCGSPNCVGYIVAKSQRRTLKSRLKKEAEASMAKSSGSSVSTSTTGMQRKKKEPSACKGPANRKRKAVTRS